MSVLPETELGRAALAAHAARLKHDLGKYVALQQRWLGPDPDIAALRDALASDVLSTRRGPAGTVDALTVWAEFRPALVGEVEVADGVRVDLSDDEEFRAVDEAMDVLSRSAAALRHGAADDEVIREGHRAALRVADGCRALERRLGSWARRVDG